MADFRGKQPTNTFQFILNTDGFNIFDSSGSVIRNLNVTTSYAVVQTSHEISSSFASSSMSSSVASTASYANTASYSPNYLNKAGDNTSGVIEFNTGGGLIFDNSSAGIVFQGVTLNDATLRIDSGFTTKLTTPSGSIYFSGSIISASAFIGTASWANNATTANTSSYPWATSGTNIYNGNTTGNVGIGTTNPTSASLTVNGNVWSKNITASLLQGTASWASNATTASYAITAVSSSYTTMDNSASGSYIIPIIQAGTGLFGGNQTVNVSFNRTMPNTFYAVSMNQNTGLVTGVVYAALGKTLTGFTGSANTSNTSSFDWVATCYV
jgi:hypothetical protein